MVAEGEQVANEQTLGTIQFGVEGLAFSAIRIDLTEDPAYLEWVMSCVKATIEAKNKILGGHMVEEAGAVPDMPPITPYIAPVGTFTAPMSSDAPPPQQSPPAAPQGAQNGQQGPPEWQSWPVMPDWHCDRDPSHEVRERPAFGNAGRRAICHICKDELKGGRSAHHVVTGGWLDN